MVVTSYGLNKNCDDETKNQEKANDSPSYRCPAIKKDREPIHSNAWIVKRRVPKKIAIQRLTAASKK